MGRNADKRKKRRDKRDESAAEERTARTAEAAVRTGSAESTKRTPPWWAETLWAQGEWPGGPDPTLGAALFRVSALIATRSLGEMGEDLLPVVEVLRDLLVADTLSVHVLAEDEEAEDPAAAKLIPVATAAALKSDQSVLRFEANDELIIEALDTRKPVRVDDAARDNRLKGAHGQRSHVGSALIVPLAPIEGEPFGVLVVTRREVSGFHDDAERRSIFVADSLAQDLEQVEHLRRALIDPETGLDGRLSIMRTFPREVERARRYQTPLSLVLLHVDGVRELSERYGPMVTREVMAEVGRRLPTAVRRADYTARFAADVFLVLTPAGPEEAAGAAQRLSRAVTDEPFRAGDAEIRLEVSAGTATMGEEEDEDALTMLLRAEESLPVPKVRDMQPSGDDPAR
jgi:diguanylate cyclase (GGDEF)-like protein